MSAVMTRSVFSIDAPSDAATPSMVISTMTPDREGDRVFPDGGDFENYKKNPIVCWAHDYRGLPIGRVTSLGVQSQGIRAAWRWLENDEWAARVKNAFEQGVVNAASIGFAPKASTPNEYGGRDITRWEMLELTLCPIPMNPEATRQLKKLGLETNASSLPIEAQIRAAFRDCVRRVVSETLAKRFSGGDPLPDPAAIPATWRGAGQPYTVTATDPAVGWDVVRQELKDYQQNTPAWMLPPSSERMHSHERAPADLKWLAPRLAAFVVERAKAHGLIT